MIGDRVDRGDYPAMWRIWGLRSSGRKRVLRLPRYWLALLTCLWHDHRWNAHSDGKRGCTRCWRWEATR